MMPGSGDETVVYPTRVVGTSIAHLALADLKTSAAGELRLVYRPICRDPAEPALLLELVPEGAPIVWCGGCSTWAASTGVVLPQGPEPPSGMSPPAP